MLHEGMPAFLGSMTVILGNFEDRDSQDYSDDALTFGLTPIAARIVAERINKGQGVGRMQLVTPKRGQSGKQSSTNAS